MQKFIVHRADPRSPVANCGANLATPGHLARLGDDPLILSDETRCTRGCYAKHRAALTPQQIRLRDVSVPLTVPQHRAEVAA